MAEDLQCKHKVPVAGTDMMHWCGNRAGVELVPDLGPRCPHHTPPAKADLHPQRTRAIIAAGKLTLDRDERRDLARMLVGHSGSWRTIEEPDARRVADALEAFLVIQALLLMRRQARGDA